MRCCWYSVKMQRWVLIPTGGTPRGCCRSPSPAGPLGSGEDGRVPCLKPHNHGPKRCFSRQDIFKQTVLYYTKRPSHHPPPTPRTRLSKIWGCLASREPIGVRSPWVPCSVLLCSWLRACSPPGWELGLASGLPPLSLHFSWEESFLFCSFSHPELMQGDQLPPPPPAARIEHC